MPPFAENAPLAPANPYGQAKLMIERILTDLAQSDPDWRIVALRYFNPVAAHESGMIGEDPTGIPNNLMPFVSQVAVGKLAQLQIFGGDYPTPDGTGVRDYIHVATLASGHVAALERLATARGLTDRDALHERKEAWADAYRHTPHGKPVELDAGRSQDK